MSDHHVRRIDHRPDRYEVVAMTDAMVDVLGGSVGQFGGSGQFLWLAIEFIVVAIAAAVLALLL